MSLKVQEGRGGSGLGNCRTELEVGSIRFLVIRPKKLVNGFVLVGLPLDAPKFEFKLGVELLLPQSRDLFFRSGSLLCCFDSLFVPFTRISGSSFFLFMRSNDI